MRLKEKVALITGAARGIGLQIAKRFLEHGATVILTDKVSLPFEISELGDNAYFMQLDVTQDTHWKQTLDWVSKQFSGLDVLVNNAGITGFEEFPEAHDPENFSIEAWEHVHATNLLGVALGCKYAIGAMKTRVSGSIVNISSRSGLVGIPAAAAYASSKAAIRNHTKSVALYCAEKGYPIRCNSVHPGAIFTPMWAQMLPTDPEELDVAKAAIAADVPLKVMGEPDDVAYACIYLASDESKYVTGIELNIDGGLLAGTSARPQN
ncbi:SDR family oxidoreductase [Pseudoalteromonas xiamenensis]|uniref:SDR family oxidoreductase n=1 Tax=Pseudoalteromonas xiamenensis TaxID=882626 RepID=UPI0027E596CE|nr:SDR family oxidoreductase [Pseudoalteromonas xiamenensis]WMN59882.1 SDR family oxidoreductase [Pseudoalteromonas xiamenensis]